LPVRLPFGYNTLLEELEVKMREKLRFWMCQPGMLSAIARVSLASFGLSLLSYIWYFVWGIAYLFVIHPALPTIPRKIVEQYAVISLPLGIVTEQKIFIFSILGMGLIALPTFLLIYLMTQRLEQRPLVSVGLAWGRRALKEFFSGLVLGLAVPSIGVLAGYWSGDLQITWNPTMLTPALIGWTFLSILGWLGVAYWEELYFRGYLLQTLISGLGIIPAVLITALSFGLLHVTTYGIQPLLLLNVTFLGIILATLYLKTKSLWAPIGMHFANNFCISHIFSMPIFDEMKMLIKVTTNGQPIHPEPLRLLWQVELPKARGLADLYTLSDLPFTLIFVGLLVLLIWKLPLFRPHPEMEALWQQYVPIAQPWAQLKAWWAKRKNKAGI
jgi:membrane protease YdiL (CAAX protease family)